MTQDAAKLSDAKRTMLEKYLHEGIPRETNAAEAVGSHLTGARKAQQGTASRAPVVAIQPGGSKVPFFFPHVHWQGGAAYCFTLAHALGSNQPFYVIDPYRFEGHQSLPSLETIAAECITSMRTIQPEGPYQLGGYCGAGFIVYEMAQQLLAAGQQVEKLVMIEPGVGPYYAPLLSWAGKGVRTTGTLLRLTPDRQLIWFLRMRHLYKAARYPDYRHAAGFSLFPQPEVLRKDWLATFIWILTAYVPRPYPGKVIYLWARDASGSHREWWCRTFAAAETEVYCVAGDRSSCRGKDLHDLAVQLHGCLNSQ